MLSGQSVHWPNSRHTPAGDVWVHLIQLLQVSEEGVRSAWIEYTMSVPASLPCAPRGDTAVTVNRVTTSLFSTCTVLGLPFAALATCWKSLSKVSHPQQNILWKRLFLINFCSHSLMGRWTPQPRHAGKETAQSFSISSLTSVSRLGQLTKFAAPSISCKQRLNVVCKHLSVKNTSTVKWGYEICCSEAN